MLGINKVVLHADNKQFLLPCGRYSGFNIPSLQHFRQVKITSKGSLGIASFPNAKRGEVLMILTLLVDSGIIFSNNTGYFTIDIW